MWLMARRIILLSLPLPSKAAAATTALVPTLLPWWRWKSPTQLQMTPARHRSCVIGRRTTEKGLLDAACSRQFVSQAATPTGTIHLPRTAAVVGLVAMETAQAQTSIAVDLVLLVDMPMPLRRQGRQRMTVPLVR